jgi:hypothetical protein
VRNGHNSGCGVWTARGRSEMQAGGLSEDRAWWGGVLPGAQHGTEGGRQHGVL